MKTGKADAALVTNTVIWGVTFVVVKRALGDISPALFLALRFALAGLALLFMYWRKLRRDALISGAICGVFLFLGYFFQTTGLQYTTPSKSAFYTSLSVPLVPLLGAMVYRRAPRPVELLGVLVATAGMLLLTTEGTRVVWDRGSFLSFLCAVAYAAHIIAVGHFSNAETGFETVATVQVLIAAVLASAVFPLAGNYRLRWTAPAIIAIIVTALFGTALAFTLQAWAQQHTTATRTALIYTLEPVWASLTSLILLGERLSWLALSGAVLILAGVLLVELKPGKPSKHPSIRAIRPEV